MTRFTIVYTDGHEEHYNVIQTKEVEAAMRLRRFKEIVENDMLQLIVEDSQIVLIPVINIQKIIAQADDIVNLKSKDFPGFIHVEVAKKK